MANAARVGLVGDHTKVGSAKKVLCDRAPQIPNRFDGAVLFSFDEGLWIEAQQFAQRAQEFSGAVQANRGLQIRAL
jgi:hypothetical protein